MNPHNIPTSQVLKALQSLRAAMGDEAYRFTLCGFVFIITGLPPAIITSYVPGDVLHALHSVSALIAAAGFFIFFPSIVLGLCYKYVKRLEPIWNGTMRFSLQWAPIPCLIGAILYAKGDLDNATQISCDVYCQKNVMWDTRLWRFLMIAAPLVIVYGGVFALWTATTYNKADARLKPVMAISWVLLILTLAVLIYFGGNIVNDSANGILPSLFNNSVQGDVRYETLVTTVGLYTMGMVMYRLLHQTSNSSGNQSELFSFLSKAKEMSPLWNEGWFRKGLISFIGVGILLAAAFWGEGLAPPGGGMPHAGVRIGFLLAWSFGSYWLFVRLGGTPPPKKPARRTKAA